MKGYEGEKKITKREGEVEIADDKIPEINLYTTIADGEDKQEIWTNTLTTASSTATEYIA